MVTDLIDRVRAALRQRGITAVALAGKAGLHRNTLYGVEREDWNPTASTLIALEPHIIAIEAGEWSTEQPSAEAA
jgi:transcriptional regulator with XRE-family HTH domain